MNARWLAFGSSAMLFVCIGNSAHAQGDAPDDKEIASAIARGVAFLNETQSDQGHWDEPSQRDHRLGMTALAGGHHTEPDDVQLAREIFGALEFDDDLLLDEQIRKILADDPSLIGNAQQRLRLHAKSTLPKLIGKRPFVNLLGESAP